jgi:starch phosphorylase
MQDDTTAYGERSIAYFSMEVALDPGMPTYSGGLGILAGDTIKAAADMKLPMVAVTLIHRKGYLNQKIDNEGWQTEEFADWAVDHFAQEIPVSVPITIEGRLVVVRAWVYEVKGTGGYVVPVYLLDTDIDVNNQWDRTITDHLYGGDQHYRLCQEVVLGSGGVRLLRTLGYNNLERFHMNEGHSSLLALELLDAEAGRAGRKVFTHQEVELVRKKCVFTTHTPVRSGHDQFPLDLVKAVLGRAEIFDMHEVFCCEGVLNMTYLALNLSHYVNGVAKRHGEISQLMFARYRIDSITNGVHVGRWASEFFAGLFDEHIPGWREDNFDLRYALKIPKEVIWQAHEKAKAQLIEYVNTTSNADFDASVFTIGFARRAATYKRADLLFADVERLKTIVNNVGPLQIVFAGKAHPQDVQGKEVIKRIIAAKTQLKDKVQVVYLPNYGIELAKLLIAGVDVWLNTPLPPLEASGTSGMKAALNGVPSLSVLDGWWIEGCIEGVTGWSIGNDEKTGISAEGTDGRDADSLYDKLEHVVMPTFYEQRNAFTEIMRHAIALNGSFFTAQRMLQQYVQKAYFI